jgi:rifampin ADP-ribosylating transferase
VTVPVLSQGDPSGPVLLLLHAWCESAGVFDRMVPRLPPWLHVIAFDQRGHGASSKPQQGYALDDFAGDVVALLDALDIAQAFLLGTSSGGYVAQQVSRAYPQRVSGLVLVGAPADLSRVPALGEELASLTDPLDPVWVRASLDWFPLYATVPDWYIAARVRDGLSAPARVWKDTFKGLVGAEPPTRGHTLRGPGLVIWGDRDDLLPREDADSLTRAIENCELIVYPRTGHLVLYEQPERVAADTVRFLERLPP